MAVYAGGSLGISITVTKGQVVLALSGSLTASAEVKAGVDQVLSFSAGAEGTVLSLSGSATITKAVIKPGYGISGGKIEVYVVARLSGKEVWKKSHTLFNGWSS